MATELDYMEYADNAAAQAAYVSSDKANVNDKLLLHLNGADGATSTTDDSDSNHTITFNGTAQLDTAIKKWGSASLLLDGDSDYLTIADSADWNILDSLVDDETIDFWIKFTDHAGSEYIISQYEDNDNYWVLYHVNGMGWAFSAQLANVNGWITNDGGETTDTNWHHIAICKVGNDLGIYVDGSQVCTVMDATITDDVVGSLTIGRWPTGANYFDGSIDEIRINHSNAFNASPQADNSDTITIPTSEHAPLRCYSEDTIKEQGTYSLKGIAKITDSLNDTLTRTVSPTIDLSDLTQIKFDIRGSRTGSQIKVGIHDSGGTTTEHTANVASADTWQTETWDISGVSNANKDVIDSIIVTVVNADADNTFYIDNMYAETAAAEVNAIFFSCAF